jgi:hypothetical protein
MEPGSCIPLGWTVVKDRITPGLDSAEDRITSGLDSGEDRIRSLGSLETLQVQVRLSS